MFRQYSRVKLTPNSDRHPATESLEARLRRHLNVHAYYGVLANNSPGGGILFRRCLLCHRSADSEPMNRIRFPPSSTIHLPSWSLVAHEGGTDYLNYQHEADGKELSEIQTPNTAPNSLGITIPGHEDLGLEAKAVLVYDEFHITRPKCAIIGLKRTEQDILCSTSFLQAGYLAARGQKSMRKRR